jgi:hypothetical protein
MNPESRPIKVDRKVMVLIDGNLEPVGFEELRMGNSFIITEPDGTSLYDGKIMTAASDAYRLQAFPPYQMFDTYGVEIL